MSSFRYRAAASLAVFLGFGMSTASPSTAQRSPIDVPEEAVTAVLTYLQRAGTLSVAWDSSRGDRPVVFRAARRQGLPVATKKELLLCTPSRSECRITSGTRRIVNFVWGFTGSDDKLQTNVIISTQIRVPDGTTDVLPALRRLTISRVGGVWRVTKDERLVTG
jgi:hypothetical protein